MLACACKAATLSETCILPCKLAETLYCRSASGGAACVAPGAVMRGPALGATSAAGTASVVACP